ncbi:esterase [[Mycobacterium] nativiensis]|uniref:Esterase n=1 Tax=[Mycobacterium] nativiensis TaxID=2855503 RepID=A0ABU5Y214_9MYCO|nr:esterase [Mycolicibacter sp. MYC340]MEB3034275.1 esterase [Mycolicibacter sp. MYC340]
MRILVAALMAGGAVGGWLGMAGLPTAQAASPCAELGGSLESGLCHVHSSTASYTLDMKFPVDYPDQQTLTDYLVQNRDGFLTVAKSPGSRDMPYEMDATSEQHRSGQAPKGTQSVVLKIFQDLGGPQPSTWFQAFNYDLANRKPITFETLFAQGSKPLEAIFPVVQRDLERQTGVPAILISSGSGMDSSHYQNFAITNEEVIFYFAPGELLPLSSGPTTVKVPRTAMPPLAV